MSGKETISVTLNESRVFKPSKTFVEKAKFKPDQIAAWTKAAARDPESYWAEAARELAWIKPWKQVCEWNPPFAKWFLGGTLNVSENCLDRHLKTNPFKTAVVWESEPGECVSWSYTHLHSQVERCTAVLRKMGLKPGDCVAIYMPMVLEAVVAMLACARGGFTHTVVFGGFSAEALKDRIADARAKVLITADGGYRKGAWLALDEQAKKAVKDCPTIQGTLWIKRVDSGRLHGVSGARCDFKASDISYTDAMGAITRAEEKELGKIEELDSEHPLFILYTSGTTGKPKGIVHTTGGYLTGVTRSTELVFDLKSSDLYWCTADIGWVTGHSYVVYGPLALGASIFIYEGAPTTPTPDRMWRMIEKHRVSILYTAPTAIRALMRLGIEHPKACDLSSLRLLGTVGEPINPEAWMWYHENIGSSRCPIVDTFWQTETGSIVVSPIPSSVASKPGSATLPLPGYDVEVVDKAGHPVPVGSGGYLVIRKPWPSMARTIHGDPERFKKQYFSDFSGGVYFTGDGARKDKDGYIWCLGRVDDVLNVSGHRLGTMEIESALVSHPFVAEAAVVGRPDDIKGQAIVAFVTLKQEHSRSIASDRAKLDQMGKDLKAHVSKEIGALARPDDLRFTEALPKTRSGKIMRRLLRELATAGQVKGDTTTLEDWNVIQALQAAQSDEE